MKVNRSGQAKVLSAAEFERIRETLPVSQHSLAVFLWCTGCRIAEACALQVSDFDLQARQVTLRSVNTKTGQSRTIPLGETFMAWIAEHPLPPQGYAFSSRGGSHATPAAFDKALRRACTLNGIQGVSTHSFRRTLLTEMASAGVNLRAIQKISGHADLATLALYLEVSDQQKLQAIAAVR
jgi:integrase/recombinase XerD